MSIKTTIHSIDVQGKSAIVTIVDEDFIIVDRKNMAIELNDDGTANTSWLTLCAKYTAYNSRLVRLDKAEDDLL